MQALTDRHAVVLASTVTSSPAAFAAVTVLDLSGNAIGDSGLAALDLVLHGRALPCLADLSLARNALRGPSAARLAAALLRTTRGLAASLRRLHVSHNPLGCAATPAGVVYLPHSNGSWSVSPADVSSCCVCGCNGHAGLI